MRNFTCNISLAAVLTTCTVFSIYLNTVYANTVAALASGANLHCAPALRHFCANVHIGCAGRSHQRTFDFTIQVYKERARIVPSSAAALEVWRGRFAGDAVFEPGDEVVVVQLGPSSEYLKVTADGRFSMRQRHRGRALMAYGRCR